MNEIIDAAIQELDREQPGRGIGRYAGEIRNLLLSKRRYEVRQEKLVDQRGQEADLKNDLLAVIDAATFIVRKGDPKNTKYVSPWNPLNEETIHKYANVMTGVFENLFKIEGFVPADQGAYQKAISVLARNFVYETGDNGELVFRKINQNGLIGEKTFSFQDIATLFNPMIDRSKSQLASELKRAERTELAKRLMNNPNPKKEFLEEKVNELKRNEIAISIPAKKLPSIGRSLIEQEFVKREALLRGLDVTNLTSNNRAILQNQARIEYEALSDPREIQNQINSIEIKTTSTWDGLTY